MLITLPGGVDGPNCVPPEVDHFADIGAPLRGDDSPGLPEGSIIRFHHRGETVDVFLYPAPAVD